MDQPQPFRFAISATFTAEPIEPVVAFWGHRLNTALETQFAPYNQPLQSLLDPAGAFAANHHGANVLLLRMEDLGEPGERLEANLQHMAAAIREASAHLPAPILVVICPPSPQTAASDAGRLFAARLEDTPGVQVLDAAAILRRYPVEEIHSPEGDRLGRIPYTELYFAALGTAIVRLAHSLFAPPYKVIALDCDNTLWQGICGEDGPTGIVVDAARRHLQQFMADQREQGMLLVLASKNNEADVVETFEQNPGMPLQMRHFSGWRLNWDSKASSLASLADELSLGLDSFIFVDDNPRECAEVEESVPEVLGLTLPEDATAIPHFLDHVWAFDHPIVTEEDRNRSAYYAQSQEFGRELRRSSSLSEFMHSLDLRVSIAPLEAGHLPRVAQLTQRTNQFNLTGARRTEGEIQDLIRAHDYECWTVDVADRFGDYGVVGALIFRAAGEVLDIDTFLLSCRALGRGVEHRMLARLAEEAIPRGLTHVGIRYVPAKRNQPARQFLAGLDFDFDTQSPIPAATLRGVEWKPQEIVAAPKASVPRPPPATRRFVEFASIARTLSTPRQIVDAMRRDTAVSHGEEMPDTERRLAVIWADLLQCRSVSVTDNFFDLGGHSLLAVLLIMRVRETFGVELPIGDVYSASLTLGELAHRIEAYQAGESTAAGYDELLAEIEGLSDEEVARLLAEEDPEGGQP